MKHLRLDEDERAYVIKNNNQYKCISTRDLKFIDILQFLPPGTNYQKFLSAYKVTERKGYLCYDWFKSPEQLKYPQLPPFEAFYSPLKGRNVLEEPSEQAEYEKDLKKWIIKFAEAMTKGGNVNKLLSEKPQPPPTARQRYQMLQDIWNEKEMKCFEDYLKYYNSLDTKPMCEAITKMLLSYRKEGIDLLKSAVSIPGIARQLLFKSAKECGVGFALFDKGNADLHRVMTNNLTGGPSIIYTRHHKVGSSYIRNNLDKMCQALFGMDANA